MPAQFCYGRRNDRLVHIAELDVTIDRGLRCGCVCPDCGRVLQAHLGAEKAWHFQHHVEDADCNPQPMTLLHAFVRDELARRRELTVPGKRLVARVEELGTTWSEPIEVQTRSFVIVHGETECLRLDVRPDVFYRLADESTVAIEVRYAHAVDEEKRRKLRWAASQSLEFDVSDLPAAGISTTQLDSVIAQPHRWRWLSNAEVLRVEGRMQDKIRWVNQAWHVRVRPGFEPKAAEAASSKLKKAQQRMTWARAQIASLRERHLSANEAAKWLGEQDKVDRVALACAALGLEPSTLPVFFMQAVTFGLGHHPYSWQVVPFMKYGIGQQAFTSHEVAQWAQVAMPDRVARYPEELSTNGFNRTAAALHTYFLALEAQGLLKSDRNRALELRAFEPRFAKASDLRRYLASRVSSEPSPA